MGSIIQFLLLLIIAPQFALSENSDCGFYKNSDSEFVRKNKEICFVARKLSESECSHVPVEQRICSPNTVDGDNDVLAGLKECGNLLGDRLTKLKDDSGVLAERLTQFGENPSAYLRNQYNIISSNTKEVLEKYGSEFEAYQELYCKTHECAVPEISCVDWLYRGEVFSRSTSPQMALTKTATCYKIKFEFDKAIVTHVLSDQFSKAIEALEIFIKDNFETYGCYKSRYAFKKFCEETPKNIAMLLGFRVGILVQQNIDTLEIAAELKTYYESLKLESKIKVNYYSLRVFTEIRMESKGIINDLNKLFSSVDGVDTQNRIKNFSGIKLKVDKKASVNKKARDRFGYEEAIGSVSDGLGYRIILKKTDPKSVKDVIDTLLKANDRGKIKILGVRNFHGPDIKPLLSKNEMDRLESEISAKSAAIDTGTNSTAKEFRTTLRDAGYTAVNIKFKTPGGKIGELQIHSEATFSVFNQEHDYYDFLMGKAVSKESDLLLRRQGFKNYNDFRQAIPPEVSGKKEEVYLWLQDKIPKTQLRYQDSFVEQYRRAREWE